jgi:CcmD family protein
MSSVHFMWAAYASVWIIHGAYITMLVRRYRRLQRELDLLPKT